MNDQTMLKLMQIGQETTWSQRPHRGKFILAHVRDQRSQPGDYINFSFNDNIAQFNNL
jgi:hypothetical protein